MTNNYLLILLGVLLALIIAFLDKPAKITYEYVENQPKHIVIQGKPPKDRWPKPHELQAPFGKAIYKKEIPPLKKELKELQVKFVAAKDPNAKKILSKKIEKKEKQLKQKENMLAALPFGIQKSRTNPITRMFHGLGVNLSYKLFSKILNKDDD